jgi:hypothetical protein
MTMTSVTLERLLGVIVAEYAQVSIVPSGRVVRGPATNADGLQSVRLDPLCRYQAGCPQNFGDFLSSAKGRDLSAKAAFPWFARSVLRYSCSTLVFSFVRCLVPEMKKRGITELSHSAGGGGTVRLAELEAFTVFVVPRQQHVIELEYSRVGPISQLVEMVGTDDYCSHNFLKCKISGIIVDLSLGQFTGTMTPLVFGSTEEYLPANPADVLHVNACPQNAVGEQLKLESASWKREASPDSVPSA